MATLWEEDLFTQFRDWVTSDSDLQAQLPGGLVQARAGAAQPYPYARLSEIVATSEDPSLDDRAFRLTLSVYDRTDDGAMAILESCLARLDDPLGHPTFRWTDRRGSWRESALVLAGEQTVDWITTEADGLPVWRGDAPLTLYAVRDQAAAAEGSA